MKKSVLLLALILMLFQPLLAEQPLFSVILNKGDNTIGKGQTAAPLVPGARLNQGEEIKVEEGGYVALIYEPSGMGIEIKKPGVYTASDLEKKAKEQPQGILAKYSRFLMSKITSSDEQNQNLNVTGAVERGDADVIEVYFPKVADVYGDEVFISWRQADNLDDYVITVKDKLDKTILIRNVKGTSYTLKLSRAPLAGEEMLIVNVRTKDKENIVSGDYGIKRITSPEERQIEEEYNAIKKVTGEDTALNRLLMASFFEENELLADALYCYYQAMQTAPNPEGFRDIYDNFLARNGLK